LVRGAFRAETLTRPVVLIAFPYLFLSAALPFTKMLCFVLLNPLNVSFSPAPMFPTIHPDLL